MISFLLQRYAETLNEEVGSGGDAQSASEDPRLSRQKEILPHHYPVLDCLFRHLCRRGRSLECCSESAMTSPPMRKKGPHPREPVVLIAWGVSSRMEVPQDERSRLTAFSSVASHLDPSRGVPLRPSGIGQASTCRASDLPRLMRDGCSVLGPKSVADGQWRLTCGTMHCCSCDIWFCRYSRCVPRRGRRRGGPLISVSLEGWSSQANSSRRGDRVRTQGSKEWSHAGHGVPRFILFSW